MSETLTHGEWGWGALPVLCRRVILFARPKLGYENLNPDVRAATLVCVGFGLSIACWISRLPCVSHDENG